MPDIRPNMISPDQLKKGLRVTEPKDGIIVTALSVGEDVAKLAEILDIVLQHFKEKYKNKFFQYAFFQYYCLKLLRLSLNEKLGIQELKLYEKFLKYVPEQLYCYIQYEFSFNLSLKSSCLVFGLTR